MASTLGSRLSFQNAKAAMLRAGKSTAGAVLSQSYLRLEVALATGVTQYKFDVLVNENASGSANFPTVNKLNLQDSFYVSQLGFFVCAPSAVGNTEFPLLTYPNTTIFSTAGAATALYTLYNGYMSMTINQRVVVPFWNLNRHMVINQTQQTATNRDQVNLGQDGFYPMEPNVVISGDKKNDLTVTLPAGLAAVQATGARLVCVMNGILAQNVTSVN
jgi:hypothetical protein